LAFVVDKKRVQDMKVNMNLTGIKELFIKELFIKELA
jgi:hypothetical protein